MSAHHPSVAASPSTEPTLAETLAAAREELTVETRRAHAGLSAIARYADRVDGIIGRIHEAACGESSHPLALVAVGGYGRRHLCLHSDIDLLAIVDGSIGAAEARTIKAILHPLWDLRLDVGHQVRELGDFETVERDNPKFLVALLDARFLAGDRGVYEQFRTASLGLESPWREPMLTSLLDLVRQRHTQFDHTQYHLEPDVKDVPGALRDVSAIREISALSDRARKTDVPVGRVREAEDFLLRVRSILHLERGRNLNLLSHDLQEVAAARFGSPGDEPQTQVEALMSTYFHHARIVSRSLAMVTKTQRRLAKMPRVALAGDLERANDGIRFTDGTLASLQPQTWLRPFAAALDEGCAVSEQVLTCIKRHGARYAPERFFPTTDERDRLLGALRPRPGLYDRLSEMHDCGLLGRMFPEFQKVYCLVIRDFYHKYTVDEHTLRTIRNLESLCESETPSRRRFGGILKELARPDLLALALVFHDVGKWTNKNHSEEGVRMALGALRRIRLPEQDVATVVFLIRHHLKMSQAAFRRDMEDPEVVRLFARVVGTEERLKMLSLLTLVDVEAVGPGVMTPWKEELLWRLYVDTYNRLTLGYGDEVIDATTLAELENNRPSDIGASDLERFAEGLPERYLRLVDREQIYEHVRLSRNLGDTEAHCALVQTEANWDLTVVTKNQPQLFAKICGVLSYFGMGILRGQAMTNHEGLAVDQFQFDDQDGFLRLNANGQAQLTRLLDDVVAGREDIDRTLRPKTLGTAQRGLDRIKTIVHADNQYSDRFTILEIVAPDAWGLLYRVSRAISVHGSDIRLVLISTEGSRAIDVFHLTKANEKLSDADAATLIGDLEHAVKGGDIDP